MNSDEPTLLDQFPGGIHKREETTEIPLSRNQRRIAKKTVKNLKVSQPLIHDLNYVTLISHLVN